MLRGKLQYNQMSWIIVNYVTDGTETFYVNELEEKNKKREKYLLRLIQKLVPVILFILRQI
jgi:hypothetical protein